MFPLGGQTNKAKDAKVQDLLSSVESTFETYKINEGVYPTTLEVGPVNEGKLPKEDYFRKVPVDPSGQPFAYTYDANTGVYQAAGVLRGDGTLTGFETVIVGNGTDLLVTDGANLGFYYDGVGFTACNAAVVITEDQVATLIDGSDGSCIPYNPLASI